MSNLKLSPSKAILPGFFVISALAASLIFAACDNSTPTTTPLPPTATTAPASTNPSGGEAIFMRYCAVCHPGGHRAAGPDIIDTIAVSTDDDLRNVVRTGRRRMPPYDQSVISDAQLTELIAYLRTLK